MSCCVDVAPSTPLLTVGSLLRAFVLRWDRSRKIGKLAVRGLDRPGGRWFLAAVGTTILRRETGDRRARMFFDDAAWIQQSGDDFVAVGKRFTFKHGSAMKHNSMIAPTSGSTCIAPPLATLSSTSALASAPKHSCFRERSVERARLAIEAHPETFEVLDAALSLE